MRFIEQLLSISPRFTLCRSRGRPSFRLVWLETRNLIKFRDIHVCLVGLVTVMFGATGTLFNISKRLQNQGKVCAVVLVQYQYEGSAPTYCGFSYAARPVQRGCLGRHDDGPGQAVDGSQTRAIRTSPYSCLLVAV